MIKRFFKDLIQAQKGCFEFYKHHWLGMIIFSLIVWLIEIIIIWPELVLSWWDRLTHKNKETE